MRKPLVSVIMSVYNAEEFLRMAVISILNQTYKDFEFIIIDDGSTDSSLSILQSFKDTRIRLLINEQNLKLPTSLNKGIAISKGKYIVRMDADDISFPKRIEKQVAYMESHPNAAMAFCDMIHFSGRKILPDFNTNNLTPNGIKATLLFYNVVNHNGVIINKSLFPNLNYPTMYSVTEDLALWLIITKTHKIHYMRENLVLYRIHEKQARSSMSEVQRQQEIKIKAPLLLELTGIQKENHQLIHSLISYKMVDISDKKLLTWLHYLDKSNQKQSSILQIPLKKC